jgi:hypothetical protein
VPAPTTEGAPIKTVTKRRDKRSEANTDSKKRESVKLDKSAQRKKTRSDDEELEKHEVDLKRMEKRPLKTKGKRDDSAKKNKKKKDKKKSKSPKEGGKKATFAETVRKEMVEEKAVDYEKCVVGFTVRVDKGNNTKGGFDKKIIEGLTFMQTYMDRNTSFHPIRLDKTLKPIKEKGNMLKYQVTMRKYFGVPNQRAFDNVSQDGGRVIRGLAAMEFTNDPQRCLDNAAGDLRMMGCAIFYKSCQEVDMVATQILVGASNTIEEEVIKQTIDKELRVLEKKLLLIEKNYTLTREQSKKWVKCAVIRKFPTGMPWEGTEEKKQKQGTTNTRLAYIWHVYQANYKRMKTLLAYAKEKDI